METVSKKEKVKLGSGLININPPPSDRRCDCCGKHIDELKPYGKAGDPLGGDFNGALLVKEWRAVGTYVEEAEKAIKGGNSVKIKELSNQTTNTASLTQDPDNIAVAVIIYSIGKILERGNYQSSSPRVSPWAELGRD